MLPPGHIAAGYLAGKLASQFIPELNKPEYLALTSLFAFLPDLDFFFAFFKLKKFISSSDANHHDYLSHAPLLYLLAFVICYLLFPDYHLVAITFIIGTWSHFIIDSISAVGILWLYPFNKKLYGLTLDRRIEITDQRFFPHWQRFVKEYTKVFSFRLEIALIIIAIWLVNK